MEIIINTDYIKLDQALKFSGIAESGADAKDMILDEIVKVNGTVCTMRGKKLVDGDTVFIDFGEGDTEEFKVKQECK